MSHLIRRMNRSAVAPIALAIFAMIVPSGCVKTEARVPLYPAHGTVRVGSMPAQGVSVTLYPASGQQPVASTLRPHAITNEQGAFVLGTYVAADGAPQGDWIVTLLWPDDRLPPAQQEELLTNGDALPDRLQGRFAAPSTSSFRVTIAPADNQLPDIVIPY